MQAFIATTLALLLVFGVGTLAYRTATAAHRQDCMSLNETYAELDKQFQSSKTHAEEIIASLEKAPHAEGFSSFSSGKKNINLIEDAIAQYSLITDACTPNSNEREYKDAIENNRRIITQIDNAATDLETSLKNFQLKNLSEQLEKQVDQFKGAKLMVSAVIERAKHQAGYVTTSGGTQNLKQAETTLSDLDAKITAYTAEVTAVEVLEERLKQIENDKKVITNAKTLVAQIDKDLAAFAKPVENEEDTKDPKKEPEKDKEKATQNQSEDNDVLLYGDNCEGDNVYEYRRSLGWDLASAKADAQAKCESIRNP
ncbi:hypothetical protein NXS08_06510 [Gleimia sp. 6138-11-ORH1]|uniref:hypothetical protein n=1 Tax=Gleimia sp. 6138-11-ORH1 TaxID=2973937 RepID=UPI00216A2059|nr:hypothetical protein [Gleimia sp. 6138-11-ORH1]MCS4485117.1 hypothetical protein [Gleimia sp. 6138-11-ORH1]